MAVSVAKGDSGKERGTGAGGGRAARPAPPQPAPACMADSVTRHADFSGPTDWTSLTCGIDTLDVSVNVHWGSRWRALLESLEGGREAAYGTSGILWEGGQWLIRPTGKPPRFRYHLQHPNYNLFLGETQNGDKQANVYISFSAELLWFRGIDGAVKTIQASIEELGGRVQSIKPSRCDLCADFVIPGGLGLEFLRKHRVPKNSKIRLEEQGENLESVYVGARKSPIQLRVYDKSKELTVKNNKQWFWRIWGIEPCADVWRVEFQIRRVILKQFRIDTMEQLKSAMPGLWDYLTDKFVSVRKNDNKNTSRRTVHPWWESVKEQKDKFGTYKPIIRNYENSSGSVKWYVSHISGCLVGFAVLLGIGNLDLASSRLLDMVRARWNKDDFIEEYNIKSIQNGRDPFIEESQSKRGGE